MSDAVIGVNPASDDNEKISNIICWLDKVRQKLQAPIQTCVLIHITHTMRLARRGVPVDLFFSVYWRNGSSE